MEKYEEACSKQLTGKAPDFTLPDAKGKKVKLSDYKGTYLLIDFGLLGVNRVELRSEN